MIALKTILTNFNQRLIFTFDVPEDQKCFQDSFYFYFTSAKKNRRLNKRSGKIRRGQGEWGNAFQTILIDIELYQIVFKKRTGYFTPIRKSYII